MSIRMRHTSSHTKNRRSHHALKNKKIITDKETGNLRMPHRLDEKTGMYRGKLIVPPKVKKEKKDYAKADKVGPAEGKVHLEKEEKPKEKKTGLLGRMTKGKAKARSGMGGGV